MVSTEYLFSMGKTFDDLMHRKEYLEDALENTKFSLNELYRYDDYEYQMELPFGNVDKSVAISNLQNDIKSIQADLIKINNRLISLQIEFGKKIDLKNKRRRI